MTKDEFYKEKHQELAKQFNVSEKTIQILRSMIIGEKKTRGEIILILNGKIAKSTIQKKIKEKCPTCNGRGKIEKIEIIQNPKKMNMEMLDLLLKTNENDWKDIIFPYKYIEQK